MGAQLSNRAAQAARHIHLLTRSSLLWISIISIVALAFLVVISVFGRALFGIPVTDDVVLAEGLLIVTVMLPLAAVQADGGHIRVELIGVKGSRFTRITDRFGNLLGALLFFTLSFATLKDTAGLFNSAEFYQGVLRVPIWPTKFLFGVGTLMLAIELTTGIFRRDVGESPNHNRTID